MAGGVSTIIMSRSRVVARNVLSNFASQVWLLLLGFLTLPYIVGKLGVDGYGILSIVGVITGYLAFLDLGLGRGLVKYISEYNAEGDVVRMEKTLGTAIIIYTFIGIAGALLIVCLAGVLAKNLFKIPANLQEVSQIVFYLSAIGFLINMPSSVFGSIPVALQQIHLASAANAAINSAQTFMAVALLFSGFGLKEVVLLNLVMSVVGMFVYINISRRLLPQLRFKPVFDFGVFRVLFRYGSYVSFSSIMSTLSAYLDKFLIGLFQPIAALTPYNVSYQLASKIWLIPANVTSSIFPTFSELDSLKEQDKIRELYCRATKYVMVGTTPIAISLVVFAGPFLSYWMGTDIARRGAFVLQLLALSAWMGGLAWVALSLLQAVGYPDIHAKITAFQAIISVILYLLLIPNFGIEGAALAWLIQQIMVSSLAIYVVTAQIINMPLSVFMPQSFLGPMVPGLLLILLDLWLRRLAVNLPAVMLIIGGSCLLYLLVAFFFPLDSRDRKVIIGWVPELRNSTLQ